MPEKPKRMRRRTPVAAPVPLTTVRLTTALDEPIRQVSAVIRQVEWPHAGTPSGFAGTGPGTGEELQGRDNPPSAPAAPGRGLSGGLSGEGLPPGFVDVETTPLVELDSVPAESAPMHERADFDQAVAGALVKVAPVLKRSERDGFVDADVRARVLEAGARACVIRPVIVPDVVEPVARRGLERMNAREQMRAWVAEHMPGVRGELLDALLVHCDRIIDEVGL